MGKTVPSYRIALEWEIDRWKGFRKALDNEEDRAVFEELMDMCRNKCMASGNACNPVIFEPMTLSILLAQHKKLMKLECKLNEVIWQEICAQHPPKTYKQTIDSTSQH